ALPSPQAAICLAKNRGGLQDRQVGRDRFHDLRWKSRIVKNPRELFSGLPQRLIIALPIIDQLFDAGKPPGIPWLMRSCDRRTTDYTTAHHITIRWNVRGLQEIRFWSIPGETKRNGSCFTGRNGE